MFKTKAASNPYLPGLVLLSLSLLIALLCFKDYGIAWDEGMQRDLGILSYNYMFKGDKALLGYMDVSHGVAFELPLVSIEKAFNLTDPRPLFLMRHLATHLFFLFSVFCGYVLIYRLFKDRFIACLGFMMLAFNPRIYVHSFVNSKDIPFLSSVTIILLLCHTAFEKKRPAWFILLGLSCGYATSIRALGILFVSFISLFLLADILTGLYRKEKVSGTIKSFLLFICSCSAMLYTTWPILWHSPLHSFSQQFLNLSHFAWPGKVLFNGETYRATNLPWFYIPGWFSITTPILWLFTGLAGFIWILVSFTRKPLAFLANTTQRHFLLYALSFCTPVISVIALHSVVYDDWRHLYFIYPPFVLLALFFIHKIAVGGKKKAVLALCILQVVFTSSFMIKNHPHQQVYFNNLVAHKEEYLRTHYDLDYWGIAYKQAFDYLLSHDTSSVIRVWWSVYPVGINRVIIPEPIRERILLVEENEHPYYFMTNFRFHPADYGYQNPVYEIKVLNSTILRVYRVP